MKINKQARLFLLFFFSATLFADEIPLKLERTLIHQNCVMIKHELEMNKQVSLLCKGVMVASVAFCCSWILYPDYKLNSDACEAVTRAMNTLTEKVELLAQQNVERVGDKKTMLGVQEASGTAFSNMRSLFGIGCSFLWGKAKKIPLYIANFVFQSATSGIVLRFIYATKKSLLDRIFYKTKQRWFSGPCTQLKKKIIELRQYVQGAHNNKLKKDQDAHATIILDLCQEIMQDTAKIIAYVSVTCKRNRGQNGKKYLQPIGLMIRKVNQVATLISDVVYTHKKTFASIQPFIMVFEQDINTVLLTFSRVVDEIKLIDLLYYNF